MGTRFYPIAKTINKCMLPVLDQPVLAYAVADCVAARAAEIAIVTAPGEAGRQVRHYFTEDRGLAAYFAARGWHDRYEPIAHLHDQASFTFIQQPRDTSRYGTVLPAILARRPHRRRRLLPDRRRRPAPARRRRLRPGRPRIGVC